MRDDRSTCRCEAFAETAADAASGTGDDGDFAAEIETRQCRARVHDASAASEDDREVLSTIARKISPVSKETAANACKPASTP